MKKTPWSLSFHLHRWLSRMFSNPPKKLLSDLIQRTFVLHNWLVLFFWLLRMMGLTWFTVLSLYWICYNTASVLSSVFFFFFAASHGGILDPQPEIYQISRCVGRWSLNHWTTREVPDFLFFTVLSNVKLTRSKNKGCHESILASTWPKFIFIQLLIYTNLLINSWEIGMQVKKQQLELDM